MSDTRSTVYSADRVQASILTLWKEMVRDLFAARELIGRLMYRDIATRYRQSFLSYLWAVIPPLVTVSIFAFLARQRVFNVGPTEMPYVVHALWGLTLWHLFAGILQATTQSLVAAGSLVTKINFTKEALVIAALGQPLLEFLIRLVPLIAVMAWYGFAPAPQSFLIPLIVIFVVLMALGLGFVLSIVNLVFRDVGNMIGVLMTFAIFLAPILYPPPTTAPFDLVNFLNPFSPLLIASQDLLVGGSLTYPYWLAAMCAFSIAVALTGWRLFRITMPKIAERA